MSGVKFDQAQLAREAEAFAQRLTRGLGLIEQIGNVEIGTTLKDAIYAEDKVVLYRYRPFPEVATRSRVRVPLLICYAMVNRPYMMDLQPDRSLIRGLLAQGVDVYLIDWGYPDGADRFRTFDDYVSGYLARCVNAVRDYAGHRRVNLLGVCQGGTMSLCYAALHRDTLLNLVTMVTPVDFRTPQNVLTRWTEHVDIDAMVATSGNVSGEMLNALFIGLQPFRLTGQKYIDLLDRIDDRQALENFLRMEKWIFDSPDQPGEMFRQFMTWFVKENRLCRNTLELGGRPVRLRDVKLPLLNIYASQDHLVPPSASTPMGSLVGSRDYESYAFPGGHIGIYVSGAAQREIPGRIAAWLKQRDPRKR
ncbi:MAG TPA: class III poly(R)-hydroxyalkanoic acid synthase subunit PhaC [Povalibacter sp.]|nr:class III poly(R)-hydroxyalkanoic acid synthase subunit PhaC [Povalibacter sp.]